MDRFSKALLAWYKVHGRHDLPWQVSDPYLRWLAEIMLQQTTVTAVIPYFERFRARFATVTALADASLDEVLALWAGLGYYARARNLHAAARLIMTRHGGSFPKTLPELTALPGIGPSTAGAILAFAYGVPAPILDANVRRVLGRYHNVTGRDTVATKRLWGYASAHTPSARVGAYTQAIMDLGALVCTKTPKCERCPVQASCGFEGQDSVLVKAPRPERSIVMPIIYNPAKGVLLLRRPPVGIWGGLWSLPECPTLHDVQGSLAALGIQGELESPRPSVRHVFTHFALIITPVPVLHGPLSCHVLENRDMMWYKGEGMGPGVPAPVKRLIKHFTETA